MEQEYNTIAQFYNAYSHTQRWLLEFVEDMLIEHHVFSGTIVDFGCGSGVLFEYLEDSLTSVGIDISELLLVHGRKNAPHATFIQADIRSYTHENADVAVSLFDTLNHLPNANDVIQTIDNMYQSVKPGGLVIFDMLGSSEAEQLLEQSYVVPVETDFGYAYFQALSEDGEEIQWIIDMYHKKDEIHFTKETTTFTERIYDLDKIREHCRGRFSHVKIYNASGEKLSNDAQLSERTFFVCIR